MKKAINKSELSALSKGDIIELPFKEDGPVQLDPLAKRYWGYVIQGEMNQDGNTTPPLVLILTEHETRNTCPPKRDDNNNWKQMWILSNAQKAALGMERNTHEALSFETLSHIVLHFETYSIEMSHLVDMSPMKLRSIGGAPQEVFFWQHYLRLFEQEKIKEHFGNLKKRKLTSENRIASEEDRRKADYSIAAMNNARLARAQGRRQQAELHAGKALAELENAKRYENLIQLKGQLREVKELLGSDGVQQQIYHKETLWGGRKADVRLRTIVGHFKNAATNSQEAGKGIEFKQLAEALETELEWVKAQRGKEPKTLASLLWIFKQSGNSQSDVFVSPARPDAPDVIQRRTLILSFAKQFAEAFQAEVAQHYSEDIASTDLSKDPANKVKADNTSLQRALKGVLNVKGVQPEMHIFVETISVSQLG